MNGHQASKGRGNRPLLSAEHPDGSRRSPVLREGHAMSNPSTRNAQPVAVSALRRAACMQLRIRRIVEPWSERARSRSPFRCWHFSRWSPHSDSALCSVGTQVPPQHGISAFVFPVPQPTERRESRRSRRGVNRSRETRALVPDTPGTRQPRSKAAGGPVAEPAGSPARSSPAPLEAQGGGPVRLAGDKVQLLKKVVPIYPPVMQSSRLEELVGARRGYPP